MINVKYETGDPTVRLGTERSAASAKKCELLRFTWGEWVSVAAVHKHSCACGRNYQGC